MVSMRKQMPALIALLIPFSAHAQADPVATGLRPPVHVVGKETVRWTIEERMAHYGVPGVSIAIIRDGEIVAFKNYGVLQAGSADRVTPDTLFSAGSVSKVAAAAIVLRLVDAGTLDLDRDVNAYLKRWKVPPGAWTADNPVTLRRLLSHTAGATVHGYPDFAPGASLPTIVQSLDGRPPAVTEPVRIVTPPGTRLRYSGGGVSIEQLIVEDVLGVDFETAARRYLFVPLGMKRSTFQQPLDPAVGNIAKAHNGRGEAVALPRGFESMPETAASGLWTSSADYARLVVAIMKSYAGKPGAFLSQPLARQMLTAVEPGSVGLGPFLSGSGFTRRFYHTGANDSYRASIEGYPATGHGLVIFTNGSSGTRLNSEIRRAVADAEAWQDSLSAEIPDVRLAAGRLQALAGTYRFVEPRSTNDVRMHIFPDLNAWTISVAGEALEIADPDGGMPDRLVPIDDSHFINLRDPAIRIEFLSGNAGKVDRLILSDGDASTEAVRVRPAN